MKCINKTKVLLISPIPPPVGGIATWSLQILDYCKRFPSSRFELFHYNSAVRNKRITDRRFLTRLISGIKDFIYHYKCIRIKVDEVKPDVVHITSSGSLGLLKEYFIVRNLRKKKINVIVHYRFGRIPELYEKNNLEWKLLYNLTKLCNKTIVLDSSSKRILDASGFNNVHLIPNPISEEKINSYKEQESRNKSILFVGHVIETKGVVDLVNAYYSLDLNLDLDIVGPFEPEFKEWILAISPEKSKKIKFWGELSTFEILKKMNSCRVFVLPSHTEGFPNVILEAMSQSCTIISTKVGAIPDMLKDECGVIINPKNFTELADNLNHILKNNELSANLGLNARKKVLEEYTMPKIFSRLENLWIN